MENIKILILGSKGFLGKNTKNYFQNKKLENKEKYECFFLERKDVDFKDKEKLGSFFEKIRPSLVINCSGVVGSSVLNDKINDFDILNDNIILNIHVLELSKKYNVKKIFVFSTYRLFSNDVRENYTEEDINTNFNLTNNIGYLSSKKVLDLQVKLFNNHNLDTKITCFILPNIFGFYDDFKPNSRIIPSLIVKIDHCKKAVKDLYIDCSAENKINLVYVDDVVKCIEESIHTCRGGNILVFNKKGVYSLKEITSVLANIMDYKQSIIFNDLVPTTSTSNSMKPDVSRFRETFDNFEFSDIYESLKLTVDHYIYMDTIGTS